MRPPRPVRAALTLIACGSLAFAGAAGARDAGTVPVLMVSDIHFDPFAGTDRGGLIDGATMRRAGAIEPGRDTLRFPQCGEDEPTTSPRLLADTLRQIRRTRTRFTVITGDLLVHQMQCRFEALHPGASAEDYAAFAERTALHVLDRVHRATGGRPMLVALGNHDSGCGNYRRAAHDAFLARLAAPIARLATADPTERDRIARSFAAHGGYWLPALPGLPRVAAAVIDTTPLSRQAKDCAGTPRATDAEALAWLDQRLSSGRHAWLIGHIPPGVDVRATVQPGAQAVVPFQQASALPRIVARHAATLSLALFGHTHMDEWRAYAGVPLRVTPAVSPSTGNRPSITVGEVRADGTLLDYRVLTPAVRPGAAWREWYAFRATYGAPAFDAASLRALSESRRAPGPQGDAYRRLYSVGNAEHGFLKSDPDWRAYACATSPAPGAEHLQCER